MIKNLKNRSRFLRQDKLNMIFLGLGSILSIWRPDLYVVSIVPYSIILLLLSFIWMLIIVPQIKLKISLMEYSMVLFLFYLIINTVGSLSTYLSLARLSNFMVCFVSFSIIHQAYSNSFLLKNIQWSLMIANLIVSLDGIRMSYFTDNLKNMDYYTRTSELEGTVNINFYAYSSAQLSAFTIYTLLTSESLQKKLLSSIVLCINMAAIISAGSRGAFISLITTLIIYYLYVFKGNFWFLIFIIMLFGIVLFVGSDYLPEFATLRLYDFFQSLTEGSNLDLSGRENIWPLAIEAFKENVFTGIGIGSFQEYSGKEIPVHNFLLSLMAETGIIGLFLFMAIMLLLAKKIVKSSPNSLVNALGLATFISWLIISLTGVWEWRPNGWVVYAWIAALKENKKI